MYTIKDVTEKLGMTAHTIRHYTDKGLVPSLTHDIHGNRLFDTAALNRLTAVRFLRESGMTIPEIKHYFDLCLEGDSTIQKRYEILADLEKKVNAELEHTKMRAHCITEKVRHYEDILSGKIPDDCNPVNW